MTEDFRERARLSPKGRLYEDFEVGEVRQHHWGRTIALADTILFTTLTLIIFIRQLPSDRLTHCQSCPHHMSPHRTS